MSYYFGGFGTNYYSFRHAEVFNFYFSRSLNFCLSTLVALAQIILFLQMKKISIFIFLKD